jgi:hypothetical protein
MIWLLLSALTATVLATFAIWSRKEAHIRGIGVFCAFVLFFGIVVGFVEATGVPKQLRLEARNVEEAAVIAHEVTQTKIYVWLRVPGMRNPMSYVMPWSERLAKELYDAKRQAENKGTGLMMAKPFEFSLETRDRLFYAAPQPKMPEKQQ